MEHSQQDIAKVSPETSPCWLSPVPGSLLWEIPARATELQAGTNSPSGTWYSPWSPPHSVPPPSSSNIPGACQPEPCWQCRGYSQGSRAMN